ncbi:MAG TPA: OmpA family protein [Burkholderiaceae bacterium]|nr:OmpA family protein [Burkholderiaceae bacterium]
MNTTRHFLRLALTTTVAAAALAACAVPPSRNAALDDATASYDRAAADAAVVRSAPLELRKAQQALEQASAAQRKGDDPAAVEHYAYLARQRTETALQSSRIAQAELAVADASRQRDSIMIDSRTREAKAQGALADKAQLEVAAQRTQTDAARKLADDRLADTRSSQAQATSAQARAKSAEEQLAEMKARPTDRGMVLTLGDVLFDTGRAELSPGANQPLDQLAMFMKEHAQRTVAIEGYTDSVGTDSLNQALSEKRAIAVKSGLIDRGVASNRVTARGLGEASPVASNDTAAGRQRNRRVEVVLSNPL